MTVASTRHQPRRPVGDLLREWRQRRRLSQLDLAIQADISARHLSFVETARSRPTSTIALLATLYASRAAATGDPVAALHDCALVLTVAAAVGAVAAACNHGVSASDAGFAQGGRHGRRHHSAAASQRADQAVPTGKR